MGLLTWINRDLLVRHGDGGIRLSGGEAQRLGIVRATYPDPRILIMDEVTANLDSETEKQIFAWLRQQQGRRTIIIVSHKLALVEWADLILYLEEGEIKKRGKTTTSSLFSQTAPIERSGDRRSSRLTDRRNAPAGNIRPGPLSSGSFQEVLQLYIELTVEKSLLWLYTFIVKMQLLLHS